MDSIDAILRKRKILISCGTGGVGKTTVSAALALRAATFGKRTCVITIDPAKRLATSLGMRVLGDEPTDLTPQLKRLAPECTGTLHAVMPDTRTTFEDFVHSLAPNPAIAQRVMRNPIFQIFAKEFSGTNEYMALQRLYSLSETRRYDCIILDTPPSRNTLAFLDAPQLLAGFFEEKLIRWLVLPTNRLVSTGMRRALGLLERLTGAGFMTNLFDFAAALFEVRVTFASNLKRISSLLESEDVGFLMVTTPSLENIPEVRHFIQTVREHRFRFDGVALNRTLGYLDGTNAQTFPADLRAAFQVLQALQQREKLALDELSAFLSVKIPELARDVHSVEDLYHVAMALGADRGR